MEEEKLLALHASLSSLRRSAGVGVSSQYSWQKNADSSSSASGVRTDGLPVNPLYNNFVKEGTYTPNAKSHGDGRAIKRDFSDCAHVSDAEQDSSDEDRKKKAQRKAEKKAAKKAAKLEAKKQAKREEKKKLRAEERKLAEATEAKQDDGPPKKKSKTQIDESNTEQQKVEKTKEETSKKDKKKSKKRPTKANPSKLVRVPGSLRGSCHVWTSHLLHTLVVD
jgi:hypothetical protein